MKVRRLPAAAESRREQIAPIARRDPGAAFDAGDRIRAAIRLLGRYPAIGRPGGRPGTRFLVVHRVEADAVTILRLFHGAQDRPNMP